MGEERRHDLAHLSSTLAKNNARVARFIDSLSRRMDQLVAAALQEDWDEVGRVSDFLVRAGDTYGFPALVESAQHVCDETKKSENQLAIKRSIVRLIGSCGKSRVKREPLHRAGSQDVHGKA